MKHLAIVLAAIMIATLTGCSAMQTRSAQTGTTLLTMKVIENASDPADKARRIKVVVDDIEQYLGDGALTISALEIYARSKIDRKRMPPSEVFLWEEAIAAVATDIRDRSPNIEILDADAREAIRTTIASIRRGLALHGY